MKYFYDLHIHSALSPCSDDDMTPNNIVNMSLIKGLDIIAVTDHNTVGNLRAVAQAAEGKILVVPGMEIETSEEVHVVCYFPSLELAEDMGELIREHLPFIKNDPAIFGNQLLINEKDEKIGTEECLLVNATDLTIYDVFDEVKKRGGVAVPAHIDRSSYSILSNLGFIPPDLELNAVEITSANLEKLEKEYKQYEILTNSDAHYLENIAEPVNFIDISSKTTEEFLKFLCKKE